MSRPHTHSPHSPHSPHYHPQSPHTVGESNAANNSVSGSGTTSGSTPDSNNSSYSPASGHCENERTTAPDSQESSTDMKSGSV